MPEQAERPILVREEDGPFLQAAVFCERVLLEQDGVASIIRIVDRLVSQAVGPDPPEKMPLLQTQISLFICLKSGFAKGSYYINVEGTSPTGRRINIGSFPVLLEGDDRGVNIAGMADLRVDEEGLYWFDIRFEKRFLTRIPLRIVYQRVRIGGPPA